jgi:aromatic-L-amino-acid decarboxylase
MTEDEISSKLVLYTSDQVPTVASSLTSKAHSSIKKACIITGISLSRFRAIPTTAKDNYTLNPTALSEAIKDDRDAGLIPFFCCATIGTTGSTAIDPIEEIGQICINKWFFIF